MRLRRYAALPIAAALLFGPVALAAPAQAAAPAAVVTAKTTKATKTTKAKKAKKTTKASTKAVRFTATGRVVAVDGAAGTLTVAVKGGDKTLRRKTVTIQVDPAAKVRLNDVTVPLADLPAGAHVAVTGTRTGDALLAFKVNAGTE